MSHYFSRLFAALAVCGLLSVGSVTHAQDVYNGYPENQVAEDEWYDPTDWFDGNNYETDDASQNDSRYDYNDQGFDPDYDQYESDQGQVYGEAYESNYGYDGGYDYEGEAAPMEYDYYTDDWWDDGGVYNNWYGN